MTHVVERITVRTSVDLIDAIGKPVTSSITMHIRGGGLFHAVVVTDSRGGQTAIYWERNENRFRTLDLDARDILNAEREWNLPVRRSNVTTPHNIMCSCSECQRRVFSPPVQAPQEIEVSESARGPLPDPATFGAAAEALTPAPAASWPLADMQMEVAALARRVEVLEAEVAAIRARENRT